MAGKYHLRKSEAGNFRFTLAAGNGETILTSESYKSKASALNGIESVKKNSADDGRYDRKDLHFNLKAGNGEPIGSSEKYSSASAMEKGIESVKKNGPDSEVVDHTDE